MKIKTIIAASSTLAALMLAMPVIAADVYVIANNALSLSEGEVRDIFVGDKQVDGATKLVPMDNASLQKDFLDKVMKIDGPKYSNIWTKKGFRDGVNPPTVKSSDAEVIAAVKSVTGAVGYVSSAPAGVKLIKKY